MFRHLMKLTWKRKHRNLMLSLEIMLAFVIVFAVTACGARYWQLYQLPVGFQYQDVWSVTLIPPDDNDIPQAGDLEVQLLQAVRALPQVRQAAFSTFPPYRSATMTGNYQLPDGSNKLNASVLDVSDDCYALLGMQLVEGRWPAAQDEGAANQAVVLNRRMAQALFPGRSPLGQVFHADSSDPKELPLRVVGVIDDFRSHGEFMAPRHFMMGRHSLVSARRIERTILLKMAPDTPRMLETSLLTQLKQVRNDWGFRVEPLASMRHDMLRNDLMPLMILAVIGVFLLAMVFFGLFGVLWQNTTRRVPEIGLRRALGAGAGDIYRQIITEQLLLSTLAMLAALVLLMQLPLTGALGESLNWSVFLGAAALSMAVIYLLSLACSLYPGWRASRLHPAAALHYE
jgi:putative ABC transport system permease protein